uniref:glutathione transferase n=1 Tax=Anopheles maculatus TaxID=74869 RepID=A0A182SNA1_9DIPT
MPLDLYYSIISPPCRVVLLFARWLKLDLNLIELDVLKREHYKPEFVKLNPQHYIPTLVDGDVVVWESSAVLIYLAEKYGTDDTLYPKDIALRAKVNQRLFYDIGTLMRSVTTYYHPILMGGEGKPEDFKKVQDAVTVLDRFLHGSRWTAGEHITVADFAIAVTVAALDGVLNFDFTVYPNVHRWYEQCKRELRSQLFVNLLAHLGQIRDVRSHRLEPSHGVRVGRQVVLHHVQRANAHEEGEIGDRQLVAGDIRCVGKIHLQHLDRTLNLGQIFVRDRFVADVQYQRLQRAALEHSTVEKQTLMDDRSFDQIFRIETVVQCILLRQVDQDGVRFPQHMPVVHQRRDGVLGIDLRATESLLTTLRV